MLFDPVQDPWLVPLISLWQCQRAGDILLSVWYRDPPGIQPNQAFIHTSRTQIFASSDTLKSGVTEVVVFLNFATLGGLLQTMRSSASICVNLDPFPTSALMAVRPRGKVRDLCNLLPVSQRRSKCLGRAKRNCKPTPPLSC